MGRDSRPPNGERSEEERTRAREERERRRRERQGAPLPPLPLPAPVAVQLPPEPVPPAAADPPALSHGPRRVSAARRVAARTGALLAIGVVLAALAGVAGVLIHRAERKPPPPAPRIVNVVIPEGYTAEQIDSLAREDGLRGDYMDAVGAAAARGTLRPSVYGAPPASRRFRRSSTGAHGLEGFLFPASYEMYAHAPASQLVSEQLAAFGAHFGGREAGRAHKLGVTAYQLLTVASIVEREAGTAHDRPLVAAVVYNRLRLGMTLGVDATLRYALRDFEHPLTAAQLATSSPYNTRLHTGLPPTPISNPGAAAIRAAAHPAHVSYLYYVAGADGCGKLVFSSSYSQFERNAAAYREALRHNGGNVPTCKRR